MLKNIDAVVKRRFTVNIYTDKRKKTHLYESSLIPDVPEDEKWTKGNSIRVAEIVMLGKPDPVHILESTHDRVNDIIIDRSKDFTIRYRKVEGTIDRAHVKVGRTLTVRSH